MRCHHCGKEIPDGKLYCPYCGTSLGVEEESDSFHDNMKSFVGGFIKDIRNGTVLRNIRTLHFNIPAVAGGLLCVVSLFLPCVVGSANGNRFCFSVLTIDETAYVIALVISSLVACFASFSQKKKFGTVMSLVMVACSMFIGFAVNDIMNSRPPEIIAEAGACVYVMLFGSWLTLFSFLFDLFVRKRVESYKTFRRVMTYKEKIDAFGEMPGDAIQSLLDRDESIAQEYAVLRGKVKNYNGAEASIGLRLIGEFVFAHEGEFSEKDRAMMHAYASDCISLDENYRLFYKLNPEKKRMNMAVLKSKLVEGGKSFVMQQFSIVTDAYDGMIKPTMRELRTGSLKRYLRKHRLLGVAIACSCLSIISVFLPYLRFSANGASLTFSGFQLETNYSVYIICFSFLALCMIIMRRRVFSIVLEALAAWSGWEIFIRVNVLLKMPYSEYVQYRFGLVLLLISCTLSLITVIFGAKINNKEYRKAKKAYKEASKSLKKLGDLPEEILDDFFCSDNCPEEIAAECMTKIDVMNNARQKGSRDMMLLALKDFVLFVQKNISLFPSQQQSILTSYTQCTISACDAGLRMIKSEEE